MRRSRYRLESFLVRAAYAACVVLVFSFILFEVLDVDGSDFPRPTSALRVNVEPPHDLRRWIPAAGMKIVPDLAPAMLRPPTAGWIRTRVDIQASSGTNSGPLRRSPSTLPRASLEAQPPSA